MDDVLITGLGIVGPLGVGREATAQALAAGTSGIRTLPDLERAGWLAPLGGQVTNFDAKQHVQPRKSLKVMAREIQFAFAAAELAWQDANLPETALDPERTGVVLGAGLMYCDLEELAEPYRLATVDGQFAFERWGEALRQFYPLWMLKYLPNMPACHIGIRRDIRGPTNTIAHGDVSSLLALGEALHLIRRGVADVVLTGGASSRLSVSDLLWRGGAELSRSLSDPATACRPFDQHRDGMVVGEGAAVLVLESARHAAARGAVPLARVHSVASRFDSTNALGDAPCHAVAGALVAALDQARIPRQQLTHVGAHGLATRGGDQGEAAGIAAALGPGALVTATKSYTGNLGAAAGAMDLALHLVAQAAGQLVVATPSAHPDPACPIELVNAPRAYRPAPFATLGYTYSGQAVAAVLESLPR